MSKYLKFGVDDRGFDFAQFTDKYGKPCSIQKSSLATEDCIWLGVDGDRTRMHITQGIAKELIEVLRLFVDTGEITSQPTPEE